ncbi:MAG: hypothetical protein ACLGI5_01840 [Thermoleophilia bacterium]
MTAQVGIAGRRTTYGPIDRSALELDRREATRRRGATATLQRSRVIADAAIFIDMQPITAAWAEEIVFEPCADPSPGAGGSTRAACQG